MATTHKITIPKKYSDLLDTDIFRNILPHMARQGPVYLTFSDSHSEINHVVRDYEFEKIRLAMAMGADNAGEHVTLKLSNTAWPRQDQGNTNINLSPICDI